MGHGWSLGVFLDLCESVTMGALRYWDLEGRRIRRRRWMHPEGDCSWEAERRCRSFPGAMVVMMDASMSQSLSSTEALSPKCVLKEDRQTLWEGSRRRRRKGNDGKRKRDNATRRRKGSGLLLYTILFLAGTGCASRVERAYQMDGRIGPRASSVSQNQFISSLSQSYFFLPAQPPLSPPYFPRPIRTSTYLSPFGILHIPPFALSLNKRQNGSDPPACADPTATLCPSKSFCCPKSTTCALTSCCLSASPTLCNEPPPPGLKPEQCPLGQIDCSVTLKSKGGGWGCCPAGWECYLSSNDDGGGRLTMCRPTEQLCDEGWSLCPKELRLLGACCPDGAECVAPGSKDAEGGDGKKDGTYVVGGMCKLPRDYRTCKESWIECNEKGLEGVCCPGGGAWECSVDSGGCKRVDEDGTDGKAGTETTTTTTAVTESVVSQETRTPTVTGQGGNGTGLETGPVDDDRPQLVPTPIPDPEKGNGGKGELDELLLDAMGGAGRVMGRGRAGVGAGAGAGIVVGMMLVGIVGVG
ncbi:hypothetical protein BDZ91DRAFT_765526 [Kalaharituber pfeilii]|nr:hypothetical protein BDZ91DRAFT_765526 [Kalaharituber pfeilii]